METVNLILLTLHNLTRWAVVVFALLALITAFSGWFEKKSFTQKDSKNLFFYTRFFEVQIILGTILMFTKGWGNIMINGGADVMSNSILRFFAVEHWLMMVIALVIAHIGGAQIKKTDESIKKYRRMAIWTLVSILLVLAAIPWPFMATGRPLLRLLGFSL